MSAERRQDRATSESSLLDLPLEVREFIYEFCYLEPHPLSSVELFDQPHSATHPEPRSKKRRLDKQVTKPTVQPKIITTCTLPQSHLSLGSICQQIRNEYFPIFARHHILSISNPLNFANDYLSYNPPHRYSDIRHLAIDWRASVPKCDCEVSTETFCSYHPAKHAPVFRDVQNLVKMVDVYPELFSNLESIRLRILSNTTISNSLLSDNATHMFKYAVLLVEKMDRIRRHEMHRQSEQKYVLAVPTPYPFVGGPEVSIFAVGGEVWDLLVDGYPLYQKKEETPDGFRLSHGHLNPVKWSNLDRFTTAVKDGTLHHDSETRRFTYLEGAAAQARGSHQKNWKAVFRDAEPSRCWRMAMSELGMWQGYRPTVNWDSTFYSL